MQKGEGKGKPSPSPSRHIGGVEGKTRILSALYWAMVCKKGHKVLGYGYEIVVESDGILSPSENPRGQLKGSEFLRIHTRTPSRHWQFSKHVSHIGPACRFSIIEETRYSPAERLTELVSSSILGTHIQRTTSS